MINASVRILSIVRGPVSKSGINLINKAPKLTKKDISLVKIFSRSGATIASNSIKSSVDGVPRVGKYK